MLAATLFSLAGCLPAFPPRPDAAPQPVFDPVAFFTGRTHGEGTLERRFGGGRRLTVEGTGAAGADGAFQLDQTITWDDGSTETRRWVLHRVGDGRYAATLSDASGEVDAEVTGNLFHLRYRIRQPRVYMEQWLYLQPGGRTVLNQAQVTVLGVPYARLSETITRQ